MARKVVFTENGIALSPNAINRSKQRTADAIILWAQMLARFRKKHGRTVQIRIDSIGGSLANPQKVPRWGIYPRPRSHNLAVHNEFFKENWPDRFPSDVDLVYTARPALAGLPMRSFNHTLDTLENISRTVFRRTGILIESLPRDRYPGRPTKPIREILSKLTGK